MALKEAFAAFEKALDKDPSEIAEELDLPTGFEVGLTNPETASHVLLRQDGPVEIASGPTANIMVDGSSDAIAITSPAIGIASKELLLSAEKIYFNYHRLDPWNLWMRGIAGDIGNTFTGDIEDKDGNLGRIAEPWIHLQSPVCTKSFINWGPGTTPFSRLVAGVPQEGQWTVDLGSFFEYRPLFGPNEFLSVMKNNLAGILESIEDLV